jgi:hypothetical protein
MKPSVSTVASASLGAPLAVIISWSLTTFAHVQVPGSVEAACGALLSAAIGYFFNGGKAIDTAQPDDTDHAGA